MNQIRRVWCRTRAKNWTRPNAAVILDTETTDLDGEIIEIAIIDAATGHTRLNTLVDPGTPIAPEATAVHGITDEMVHGAPRWPQLWPRLAPLLHKGTVLAWNAPFDRGRIHHECVRHGIPTPRARWRCLMRLAARHTNTRRRALNGGHRALDDTLQAWSELHAIAQTTHHLQQRRTSTQLSTEGI